MVKRKVSEDDISSEDSPSSLDGADYTEQGWTTRAGNDWRSFAWAFGLGPSSSTSSSTVVGRRRARRGAAARKGGATPRGGGKAEESEAMKELLEIVLWGGGESEIDITAELTDEFDSDDEELECIKRAMAREQTIRPRAVAAAGGVARLANGGKKESGGGGAETTGVKASSGHLSVSCLRFDSLLKIGSTAESSKKTSITRLEQRTTTMDRAFKGVLEDNYMSPSSVSMTSSMKTTTSSSTVVAGDEENFWDDVEF